MRNDQAVSPVIGVILMVAITVILAAVIAAFVFGAAGNIGKSYTVAVTVQKTSFTSANVVFSGGKDSDQLAIITVKENGVSQGTITQDSITKRIPVGSTLLIQLNQSRPAGEVKDHIVVTGMFLDGTEQIITDMMI